MTYLVKSLLLVKTEEDLRFPEWMNNEEEQVVINRPRLHTARLVWTYH